MEETPQVPECLELFEQGTSRFRRRIGEGRLGSDQQLPVCPRRFTARDRQLPR